MKNLKILLVFCMSLALLLGGFFVQTSLAQPGPPGDVNDDEVVSSGDVGYLRNYLYVGGPAPPYPIDADVDGTAGISLGDLYQLIGYLFIGCPLEPYTGVGPSFSEIRFNLFPALPPGPLGPFNVTLRIITNPGPDLTDIVIPFSYQNDPGSVEATLDSVNFTGSVVPFEWGKGIKIDNINKRAFLWFESPSEDLPLTSGTTGLIVTLNFTRTASPVGCPATYLRPTIFPPTHSPMLIGSYWANGTPSDRILIPKPAKNGDLNLDGQINSADFSFLINWLFVYGPYQSIW